MIEVGVYVSKYTVAKTVQDFQHNGLTEQVVSDFKKVAVKLTKFKKQGRPSLLPEEIMKKTIDIVVSVLPF